jgi:hypothetical protein
VKISFVAGFGPIIRDGEESRRFWGDTGFTLAEIAPDYYGADDVDGVRAFALWPLSQAAESTFGATEWPAELPVPQAWIELDVESPEAVGEGAAELQSAGHRLLREAREEPWKQTTARLLSPEGLLVGISYTPWMHETAEPAAS